MTISGLKLRNDVGLHETVETIKDASERVEWTLSKGKNRVYWTLVQYGEDREKEFRVAFQ